MLIIILGVMRNGMRIEVIIMHIAIYVLVTAI